MGKFKFLPREVSRFPWLCTVNYDQRRQTKRTINALDVHKSLKCQIVRCECTNTWVSTMRFDQTRSLHYRCLLWFHGCQLAHLRSSHICSPPGDPFTDLERMFMMFSFETWIAIAITFVIALMATFSLNFVSAKVRNFIAGRDFETQQWTLSQFS